MLARCQFRHHTAKQGMHIGLACKHGIHKPPVFNSANAVSSQELSIPKHNMRFAIYGQRPVQQGSRLAYGGCPQNYLPA